MFQTPKGVFSTRRGRDVLLYPDRATFYNRGEGRRKRTEGWSTGARPVHSPTHWAWLRRMGGGGLMVSRNHVVRGDGICDRTSEPGLDRQITRMRRLGVPRIHSEYLR